ncbi:MAG: hypothetical protein LBB90_06245 [Tannerella sp.]|nr:hypothetical protein [Tannerella sp.]
MSYPCASLQGMDLGDREDETGVYFTSVDGTASVRVPAGVTPGKCG